MHWLCWLMAAAVGSCGGYLLHSVRVRMMTVREQRDLAQLKSQLNDAIATVEAVNDLILRRERMRMPTSGTPRNRLQ